MTRIAHLTDLHLLEDHHQRRPTSGRMRLRYLSFGRPLDAAARRDRALEALREAKATRPDHLLITGDLTEDGTSEQFEVLAELLSESRIPPERITLVPGNHDAYDGADTWETALDGPLAPYRATSTQIVILCETTIVPVSTAIHQPCTRSMGRTAAADLSRLETLAKESSVAHRAMVIAQHHHPYAYRTPVMQWIDGFRDHVPMRSMLAQHPRSYVLHGHVHRSHDRSVGPDRSPQIFSAEAVVDSKNPLRLYEARGGELWPVVQNSPQMGPACVVVAA